MKSLFYSIIFLVAGVFSLKVAEASTQFNLNIGYSRGGFNSFQAPYWYGGAHLFNGIYAGAAARAYMPIMPAMPIMPVMGQAVGCVGIALHPCVMPRPVVPPVCGVPALPCYPGALYTGGRHAHTQIGAQLAVGSSSNGPSSSFSIGGGFHYSR